MNTWDWLRLMAQVTPNRFECIRRWSHEPFWLNKDQGELAATDGRRILVAKVADCDSLIAKDPVGETSRVFLESAQKFASLDNYPSLAPVDLYRLWQWSRSKQYESEGKWYGTIRGKMFDLGLFRRLVKAICHLSHEEKIVQVGLCKQQQMGMVLGSGWRLVAMSAVGSTDTSRGSELLRGAFQ